MLRLISYQLKFIKQSSSQRVQLIRNYSLIQINNADILPPSLIKDSVNTKVQIDIANDKVENWASPAYADLPFRPDFNLFEPIRKSHSSSEGIILGDVIPKLKTRINTNLCNRLVYLIQFDPQASEQLKTEIIKEAIDLPANLIVTSHCFDFLFRFNNTRSYLEWLPLVGSCHLNQYNSPNRLPPFSTTEIHLNHFLKLTPYDLPSISIFLNILITKKCFSRHLCFSIIRHLVRTQVPTITISFMEKTFSMLKNQSNSLDLIKPSQDFLILQLANQGYISDALQLFYAKRLLLKDEQEQIRTYPLLYQVLADQLVSRVNKDTSKSSQRWISKLEELTSLWRMDHETSLQSWLGSDTRKYLQPPNPPSLTNQISIKFNRVFSNTASVNPQVCQEFSLNKLTDFTHYFWSLLNQSNHPKFVKAAKLANEIHQILPLRHSILDLQEKLELDEIQQGDQKTEEQILKSIILEPPPFLLDMLSQKVEKQMPTFQKFKFETRSDLVFLWAHSWMIFYHRSGQPHRAIQVFFNYFMPIGCDQRLFDQFQFDSGNSSQRSQFLQVLTKPADRQNYQKLIHPTTGVLTVLYDSILSISPPKFIPLVFESFLHQHFHQQSDSTSNLNSSLTFKKRLFPNLGSFRPFVKAFLKINDVDSALNVLKVMHFHLNKATDITNLEDEGGWIDLLEWCAIHSSGPKPQEFDPNYHWGDQRKKKVKGWDGKAKEDLIYIILNKFFSLKYHMLATPSAHLSTSSIESSHLNYLENPDKSQVSHLPKIDINQTESKIQTSIQDSKIFKVKNFLIEGKLNFLNNSHEENSFLLSKMRSNFPSLKLILKMKFGFYLSKNSSGLKFSNKLLSCYK